MVYGIEWRGYSLTLIFLFKISWINNISARRRAIVLYDCGLHLILLENARILLHLGQDRFT
jgi:hypothetical protein